MRLPSLILFLPALAFAADPWLQRVEPIMNSAERKLYTELRDDSARQSFRKSFWAGKAVSEVEYLQRVESIDAMFGGEKPGSGANTDQGRVYLSLGAPTSISRLPSSRVFVPCEIWYYDSLPRFGLGTQARLLFFRKEGAGSMQLYSPQLNSLRTLLIPNSGTRGLFPINDVIRASDVPNSLNLPPAEMEVVDAASSLARGITGSGNSELLNMAVAPAYALRGTPKERVQSRLLLSERPVLGTFQSWTPERLPVIDLHINAVVRARIGLSVELAGTPLDEWATQLQFDSSTPVSYVHRLFLLPGDYTVIVDADGVRTPYPLHVEKPAASTAILLGASEDSPASAPFRFGILRLLPAPTPRVAMIQSSAPGRVQWRLARGVEVLSVATTEADASGFASYNLPTQLPAGTVSLQARVNGEVVEIRLPITKAEGADRRILVSHNANLGPAAALLSIGRQFLLNANHQQARLCFTRALTQIRNADTLSALGRLEAMDGHLDQGRSMLEEALGLDARHFDALTAMAFVESEYQDYAVAAEYLERALQVRRMPALEQALSDLKGRLRAGR
ncbi:GWxTD domain-containing protein [uncultured Paludibaculum sp.]|uniref:GWxTD domain-containing protein n=1 Tax=uncultured Paludibaculum sp. TaxID=1765020 RepID=UPI002AAA84AE|nr:GWxTD domain-containing protein [uncultured Paludibaculum sp.]